MFEEAAIARRESISTQNSASSGRSGDKRDSTSGLHGTVGKTTLFSCQTTRPRTNNDKNWHKTFFSRIRFCFFKVSTSMDSPQPRTMSTTEIDLESVLQVRRRRLSLTTPQPTQESYRYSDVVILKVEKSNDLLKEEARCILHGSFLLLSLKILNECSSRFQEIIMSYLIFSKSIHHT